MLQICKNHKLVEASGRFLINRVRTIEIKSIRIYQDATAQELKQADYN